MLAIFVSSLGYGSFPILAKLALAQGVGVVPLLAWRFLLGTSLIWAYVFLTRRRLPSRSKVPGLLGIGILYSANALLFMLGLDRLPASLATIVFFSYPVVTVLLARVWIGEPLTSHRMVALALATIGSTLTVTSGFGGGNALGIIFIVLTVLVLASFIVRSGLVMTDVPGISGTATFLTATTVVVWIVGLATGGIGVPIERGALLLLGTLAFWSTAIPITLFMIGIQWIGPARAAIFATLEPAITLTLAALVLGDRLSAIQWFGASFIVTGVVWLRMERTPPESVH